MIVYDKLFKLLKEKGYTATKIKETNLIGQSSYYGLKKGVSGLDQKTIDKLCRVLNCQPADIMEYVPDKEND